MSAHHHVIFDNHFNHLQLLYASPLEPNTLASSILPTSFPARFIVSVRGCRLTCENVTRTCQAAISFTVVVGVQLQLHSLALPQREHVQRTIRASDMLQPADELTDEGSGVTVRL